MHTLFFINDALPIVAQPEGEHFLELEIAVVLFRQVHAIVETGMEEYLGRQITAYLEVQGIFPISYHFIVSGEEIELRNERNVLANLPIQVTGNLRTEHVGHSLIGIHIKGTTVNNILVVDIYKGIRERRTHHREIIILFVQLVIHTEVYLYHTVTGEEAPPEPITTEVTFTNVNYEERRVTERLCATTIAK